MNKHTLLGPAEWTASCVSPLFRWRIFGNIMVQWPTDRGVSSYRSHMVSTAKHTKPHPVNGRVALVRFWHHTPTSCNAVWILCSRAKSPMKNCNRRVNYCRMLTQNLNFMNTHAKKICIYVNSVALLYGLSIHKYFIWSFLNHKATI